MKTIISHITIVSQEKLWNKAWLLALATIFYNIIEGLVSVWYGLNDETIALFGFGADSFIEVVSAMGVAHMIVRMRRQGTTKRDDFERTALRITGVCFYVLTATLVLTAGYSIVIGHKPDTTIAGIVVSLVSIGFMWLLIQQKMQVGNALSSEPILADARCSRVCLRMSVVLLVSSALYALTGIGVVDALGAAVLAWYSYKEGAECFEKASKAEIGCADDCC